jgi:FAD/FMN-containing dehydrogenase
MHESKINELRARLRGELVLPDDAAYEGARRSYNALIDRRPGLIARCADVADVIAAVGFARDEDVDLAVRGGNHNVAGLGTCDGGLVLDLAPMRGIRIDPVNRTARVEGGCLWRDLDHAAHVFGLATPGGIISTTGIGGLTLGGGIGYLTRRFGLSCDNLLSADVVTADGSFLTVGPDEHDDLFWALRGGGGNFGVVTSFEFRLHPLETVLGGIVFYPIDRCTEVLRFYLELMADAPEELGLVFAFLQGPMADFVPEPLRGTPLCAIAGCHIGADAEADAALEPVRRFGPPALDLMGRMPYPALQQMFDPSYPAGLSLFERSDFMPAISDDVIAIHAKHGPEVPTPLSGVFLYPTGGAAHRVGADETAFALRDAEFVHLIAAIDPEPTVTRRHTGWVRDYWSALHPHSAGGAYVNWMGDEGADRVAATYRGNYERLRAVKAKYDPANLFHLNQNIKPPVCDER